ncbi:transcription antitermination protein NusB [Parvicella tangerina]|uniref:Transcription antitermination protein NusB n=1 Tax=Parvicella tangerina TaxID=2829795 RepID=A0A916NGM3_9FLAO|nr:transcription antitermination factor NusB [Parvicella tangerina]CAG5080795.1 Transcription antitermination protein NusB [Parvicella tangerina]
MLNRRHLRIKVLQALYAFKQSSNENYSAGEKELLHSIDKMYDLYILYLLIFEELREFADRKIEERKRKIRPTDGDINPNLNFVHNRFIAKLEENRMLHRQAEELKLNWVGDVNQDLIKKLYQQIEKSDLYEQYMALESTDFNVDKDFCIQLFKKEIANSTILLNHFEEIRIHWQDDFDHVFSMLIKTLKSIKEDANEDTPIMELYKDDEKDFVKKLFRRSIANFSDHVEFLDKYTKNWESDRLAKMDIIIMNLAITEAKEFPTIPLKVSLNEYIEISKFYSTPKSNVFINGVLDKAFADLNKEGEIRKVGRGLI